MLSCHMWLVARVLDPVIRGMTITTESPPGQCWSGRIGLPFPMVISQVTAVSNVKRREPGIPNPEVLSNTSSRKSHPEKIILGTFLEISEHHI